MRTTIATMKKAGTKGASLVEYGILVGLVAVLAIPAVLGLGDRISLTFGEVESAVRLADGTEGVAPGPGGGEEETGGAVVMSVRHYSFADFENGSFIPAGEMVTPGYAYRINGQTVTSHDDIDVSSTPLVGPDGVTHEKVGPELASCALATYQTRSSGLSSYVEIDGAMVWGTFDMVVTQTFEHDAHGWERNVRTQEVATDRDTGQRHTSVIERTGTPGGAWINMSLLQALPNRPVPAGC